MFAAMDEEQEGVRQELLEQKAGAVRQAVVYDDLDLVQSDPIAERLEAEREKHRIRCGL
jgi:hypothetical protein